MGGREDGRGGQDKCVRRIQGLGIGDGSQTRWYVWQYDSCSLLTSAGMEKLQKSMTVYVKSISKRNEIEDREKILPVAYLGQTMIHHGEDFEPDSEFGNCLIGAYTGLGVRDTC